MIQFILISLFTGILSASILAQDEQPLIEDREDAEQIEQAEQVELNAEFRGRSKKFKNIRVCGKACINALEVGCNAVIDGNLTIDGTTTVNNNVIVNGTTTFQGPVAFSPSGNISGVSTYSFLAYSSVAQSFHGTQATSPVIFDTTVFNTHGNYDGSSIYTAPADGLYALIVHASVQPTNYGSGSDYFFDQASLQVTVNGIVLPYLVNVPWSDTGFTPIAPQYAAQYLPINNLLLLNKGDVVQVTYTTSDGVPPAYPEQIQIGASFAITYIAGVS